MLADVGLEGSSVAGGAGDRRVATRFGRAFRRWAENPLAFFYAPLVVSALFVLVARSVTWRERGAIVLLALLAAIWHAGWLRLAREAKGGRGMAALVAVTYLGVAILGALVRIDFAFAIILVPFIPRVFVTLPLFWGWLAAGTILLQVDAAFGAEIRAGGSGLPVLVTGVRLFVMFVIGVFLKTLVAQAEDRQRLLESLATSERRSGVLEERHRLAREIHDTLAQGFAAITVHLETAQLERERSPGAADGHVDAARTVARDSLEEARRMMAALRPELLDGADLPRALERVAAEWCRRTGVRCETTVTGDPVPLQRDLEVALLRTAQEALANVWRHARAGRASVTLSYIGDVVALDVQDDGVGGALEANGDGRGGLGLRGMRERAELLGGSLDVESAPGEGTTVTATLPAAPASAERVSAAQVAR